MIPIQDIKFTYRQDYAWKNAATRLNLQGQAICRGLMEGDRVAGKKVFKQVTKGDTENQAAFMLTAPIAEAFKSLDKERGRSERELQKMGKSLPHAGEVLSIGGFGPHSYACLLAEAGEITNYENPAKLWKRFGLAVLNGERQRKCKDKTKALEHGYSPRRRAFMSVLVDNVAFGPYKDERYRDLYDQRLVYEQTKVEGKMHAIKRTKRWLAKRLLLHVWQIWHNEDLDWHV